MLHSIVVILPRDSLLRALRIAPLTSLTPPRWRSVDTQSMVCPGLQRGQLGGSLPGRRLPRVPLALPVQGSRRNRTEASPVFRGTACRQFPRVVSRPAALMHCGLWGPPQAGAPALPPGRHKQRSGCTAPAACSRRRPAQPWSRPAAGCGAPADPHQSCHPSLVLS